MSKRYFIECTVTECKISSKEILESVDDSSSNPNKLVLFKVKGTKGFLNQDAKESKEFNIFFPCDIGTKDGLPNPIASSAIVLDTNTFITIGAADANILQILASSISQGRKIKLEFENCKYDNENECFILTVCDITIY